MLDQTLRITEVFHSLQGESATAGLPTVFIRLTGCPLRCSYCDSEYAFYGGEKRSLSDLLQQVQSYKARYVCVTGGEPLAQKNCLSLLSLLCDKALSVSLETSGAMDISAVDPRTSIVMDLKAPSSGEVDRNRWQNIDLLERKDQVKVVISDRKDFDWACMQIDQYQLMARVQNVIFTPNYEHIEPTELANWVVDSGRNIRFQIQLHKLLWGDKPGV